ncbi:MAG: IPT/TIG domain-containing protein [Bryobacterales bacterium]|nr:IPT/TIG domain-containing protein [Bryobacterales bacterium]
MRESKQRRVPSALVRPALWFCACNLLAAALAAQCTSPTQVPNGTYTSGDHSQVDNNALAASNFSVSSGATATFVAGNCIHLGPGFRANAVGATVPTTFHAWVDIAPSAVSFLPSNQTGLSQPFTWTVSSPAGRSNLSHVFALFNTTSASTSNACYIHYDVSTNLVYLADNASTNWLGGFVPSGSGSATNSQCTISGTGSSPNPTSSGTQLGLTLNVTFNATTFSGAKNEYLYALDGAGVSTGWQQMGTWTVGNPTGFTPIRISAGGPYTDSLGQYWAADYGYLQSLGTWSTTAIISGTSDQRLYQTERYNYPGPLVYQFGVPNGNYTVTLKFAEIYDSAPGQRYQNIALNGTTVVTGLDVWIAAGGPNRAYDRSFPVTVTNGQLTISLTCTSPNNSAEVNAIQIVAGGAPQQFSLTTAVSPGGSGTLNFSPPCCTYNPGTPVTITATPGSGYQFSSFTGVDSSNGSVGYVTMNANRNVTANFTASPPNITGISPASGTVGTPVTITGTDFGTSGTVSFNGTPAQQIDSWSPTTVIARVPVGATTGAISLSTGGYQTSYQAQQFQVTAIGVTVSPTSVTLGQGQTQQFTATVTGTTNQQVTWSVAPTGAWSISSTGLFTAPGTIAALQTVTVTATSVAQQTATGTATVSLVPPTPTITSLSLPSGPAQVGLVINGSNFGSAQGSVAIKGLTGGDRVLTVIGWSTNSITVQVPGTTPQGAGQVQVTTSGNATSNQVPFTVSATFGCNF